VARGVRWGDPVAEGARKPDNEVWGSVTHPPSPMQSPPPTRTPSHPPARRHREAPPLAPVIVATEAGPSRKRLPKGF